MKLLTLQAAFDSIYYISDKDVQNDHGGDWARAMASLIDDNGITIFDPGQLRVVSVDDIEYEPEDE